MAVDSTMQAGIYTDFGGLAQLRAMASASSGTANATDNKENEAAKEVANQFEALFLQSLLKAMRDASELGESTDSDQTRFYMDMFDKQIAIDLASRGAIGLADLMGDALNGNASLPTGSTNAVELIKSQLENSAALVNKQPLEDG